MGRDAEHVTSYNCISKCKTSSAVIRALFEDLGEIFGHFFQHVLVFEFFFAAGLASLFRVGGGFFDDWKSSLDDPFVLAYRFSVGSFPDEELFIVVSVVIR